MSVNRNNRRGQAILEGALVSLVFLVLFIGILDVSLVLFVHQSLVERARSAVRYGVVNAYDADAIENMVLYGQPTTPGLEEDDGDDGGGGTASGFLGLTSGMVSVSRLDATFNEDRIVVTISNYPFTFFTPFIAGVYQAKPIVATLPYEGV